jgi:hypothetical protein
LLKREDVKLSVNGGSKIHRILKRVMSQKRLTNKMIEYFLSKDFNFPDARIEEIKFEEIFIMETVS